ncbi:UNVERIFIED_CONTAM: hypothetical protein NY603_21365, partial [Bacteroidetes bacterium 56_B9]
RKGKPLGLPYQGSKKKISKKIIEIIKQNFGTDKPIYEISDKRFKRVFEFEKARSTMQGGAAGGRTEKLFMAV